MEDNSDAPMNGGLNSASGPAAANPSQTSEEPKSSPVASMSGALQAEDAKDSPKSTDDAEGTCITNPLCFVQVHYAD